MTVVPTAAAALMAFLYYGYFFVLGYVVSNPPQQQPKGPIEINADRHDIVVLQDGETTFLHQIPPEYVGDGTVVQTNPCTDELNGTNVRASGLDLYEYVRKHSNVVIEDLAAADRNQTSVYQENRIFYFNCSGGQIDSLHACRPGTVFGWEKCEMVNPCTGVEEKKTFSDATDRHFYYECIEGYNHFLRKKCPDGEIFHVDSCHGLPDLAEECEADKTFHLPIDHKRFVVCSGGGPVLRVCPSGQMVVGRTCESDACHGKIDGSRVPMKDDESTHVPFRYSPGYHECRGGRVVRSVLCPNDWDRSLSGGEDLTALPRVFKEGKCVPPELCVNVQVEENTTYPDHVVPAYHFRKRVREWRNAHLFDATFGYQCDRGGVKRKLDAPSGQSIKKFKFADGCGGGVTRVPLVNVATAYFDCVTKEEVDCQDEHYFDGERCRPRHSDAFSFGGVDMFRFEGLGEHDGWIGPIDYSNEPPVEPCVEPESVYLNGYNLCSHPDCAQFAYLAHLDKGFGFSHDGHTCYTDGSRIVKTLAPLFDSEFDFWNQRGCIDDWHPRTEEPTKAAPDCVFGTKIESGFFVLDSTVYKTCDAALPFVFCPSPKTTGIEMIGESRYACKPPEKFFMEAGQNAQFEANQLERIEALSDETRIGIDDLPLMPMVGRFMEIGGRRTKIRVDKRVRLHYRYTATLPPRAYYEGSKPVYIDNPEYNFLLKAAGRTGKPLAIPKFLLKDVAAGFTN